MTSPTGVPTLTDHRTFYGLDHLRAFAILFVFLYHYQILSPGKPAWLSDAARFGWTGVDLFFVLSGFLIASQLFKQIVRRQSISLKEFFLKRFFRIVPAFLVVVGIYFCIPFFREKEALPPLWRFLTFTQNFSLNIKELGTFSHAWSLCVEEHFYLIFPILLILLYRTVLFKRSYWLIIIIFLCGIAIRHYSFNELYLPHTDAEGAWVYWYKYIYYPTYNRLDGLLAGVSLAGIYHFLPRTWSRISRSGNLLILLGLLILTGAYFLCYDARTYPASVFGFPLVAIGYGCIAAGAISPASFLYKWNSKVTAYIATISYAVYLTHKGMIHITQQLFASFNTEINSGFVLLSSIVVCTLGAMVLHLAVEKPFMKLRNRMIERKDLPFENTL